MKNSVCAIVITYNRKYLLLECLEALRKQTRPIQGIYLIDNSSTDGTPELLLEEGYFGELPSQKVIEPWEKEFTIQNLTDGSPIKLHYVRKHENTGGAGGFYEGVKRGFERGYDWLWLMDDDAEPKKDTLDKLFLHKSETDVCLCPIILGFNGQYQLYHHKKINKIIMLDKPISDNLKELKDKIEIDANAFVGPLINRIVIDKIGFPIKEMFIWGDDTEFTYRIKQKYKIYLIKDSIILHKDNNLGINGRMQATQRWKLFYYFKNKIFFIRIYSPLNIISYMYYVYKASRTTAGLVLKHRDYKNCSLPLKGIILGFKGKILHIS
jgi:GT2 family glycosyltransferase